MQKNIKIFLGAEVLILATNFISYSFFLNAQVAFLSSFLVLMGSMYSYKKLVQTRVENEVFIDDERDELDKLDDPHGLYEEQTVQELQAAVAEEKKQTKTSNLKNVKTSSRATVSLFRILPYLFLVAGFIGLKNNHHLELLPYLLFLSLGLPVGYLIGKNIFLPKQ
ncbi:MAG: hypothetical protein PHX13_06795 [Thiovulaceae bacterium]|nr:hypothetical protein [Sulfurimonadaceae bacterium]